MEVDSWTALALLGAMSILAGFVHSAIGFGFGIVAVATFPFVINTHDAHLVISTSAVPVVASAAWAYRQGVEWCSLRPALLGAAIFLPLGLVLFGAMSLDWLVRGTGVAILAMVLLSMRNRGPAVQRKDGTGSSFIAGAVGGFLAGAVSIAGPPIAAYALRQNWSPEKFKAFVTQCLLLISIYKVLGLVVGGMLHTTAVFQAIWVTPFALVGIQLGVVASRHLDARRFYWVVAVALIGVALTFLV